MKEVSKFPLPGKDYSGYVSLTLTGKRLDPEHITRVLRIVPHRSFRKGDPRNIIEGKKSSPEVWPHGLWSIDSYPDIRSDELTLHFEWLLNQLEPVQEGMEQILSDKTIDARISCFWLERSDHINIEVESSLIARLANLNMKIWFDVYCSQNE